MTYISTQLTKDRSSVMVWERKSNQRNLKYYPAPHYFYVEHNTGKYTSIFNKKLKRYDFETSGEFYRTKEDLKNKGIKLYESDISPEYKVLSEEYYDTDINDLNITLYDIETDYDPNIGYATTDNPYGEITAISLYHKYSNRSVVITVPPKNDLWNREEIEAIARENNCDLFICKNEKQLLEKFLEEIENTDVMSGWNSAGYDDIYTYERLNKVLNNSGRKLGFPEAKDPFYKEEYNEKFKQFEKRLVITGRVFIDYMLIFKKFITGERESFSLESVAADELPDTLKLEYDGSLYTLYNNNYAHFIRYNIRDTQILKGLEEKFGFIQLSIEASHIDTAMIKDVTGTVKMAEMALINHCHYKLSKKVPDTKERIITNEKFTGAFVLPVRVGLQEKSASVDVKSLYPSAIRAVNISPETLVGQFYEKHLAYEEITKKSDVELTILYENDMSETKTAREWSSYIKESNWSLSGYGTIFDQEITGFIPELLSERFSKRIDYQILMKELSEELSEISKTDGKYKQIEEKISYYDRLQTIAKLFCNSLYGAMGNTFFKFFDIRLAESTTRSGQAVLNHMIRLIASKLDGEYTYPSNSIIAGDTDSCYFLTYAENVDEALLIAQMIQKIINKSFESFVIDNFFIDKTKSNYIKVEQEIVSDYGIYVAKKNYILHLNYKDGKPVDKIKITGLQIKKTNIPKPIAKQLVKFTENLLRGKVIKDFSRELVEYRDTVKNSELLQIGSPTSVNNVQKYTDEFLLNVKTRLPGHVAASILWNACLKQFDDHESQKIVSGSKVKKFKLKKKYLYNGRQFTSIAVPSDSKKLPLWFIDNFDKLVDREQQMVTLIDKPFEKITTAINEQLPTKNLLLIEDEFEY